jgi:hypothetical protein
MRASDPVATRYGSASIISTTRGRYRPSSSRRSWTSSRRCPCSPGRRRSSRSSGSCLRTSSCARRCPRNSAPPRSRTTAANSRSCRARRTGTRCNDTARTAAKARTGPSSSTKSSGLPRQACGTRMRSRQRHRARRRWRCAVSAAASALARSPRRPGRRGRVGSFSLRSPGRHRAMQPARPRGHGPRCRRTSRSRRRAAHRCPRRTASGGRAGRGRRSARTAPR